MTDPRQAEREAVQVDALVADRYLDALLTGGDRHALDVPADATLDPELRLAARVLRRTLVRVHPSFRFEERLAGRLFELAASGEAASSPTLSPAGPTGSVVPFPARPPAAGLDRLGADPLLEAILRGHLDPADPEAVERAGALPAGRRPLLVGGAITSAAISIAGVAFVAWRASRPSGRSGMGAMGRAARSARARRAAALAGVGLGGPV